VLVLDYNGGGAGAGGESLDDLKEAMEQASGASASPQATPAEQSPGAVHTEAPTPTPEPLPELENPNAEDTFDTGGSIIIVGNRAMEIPYAHQDALERYAGIINRIAEENPDCAVYCLITPNSGEFYSPEAYHTGTKSQKDMIDSVYGALSSQVTGIDAYSALRQHTDEYIYFRTDHHWTALGAYYAYTALCESMELTPVSLEYFRTGRYDTFLGSLYRWSSQYAQAQALKDDPDYLEYYFPLAECSAQYYTTTALDDGIEIPVIDTTIDADYSNKYLCFIRGDTPICHITSSCDSGKSCVVLKESYANALVPFLTSHYEDIYVVDPRKFNNDDFPARFKLSEFVAEHAIDDIIAVNYPFTINNNSLIGLLESVCGE